MVNHTQRKIPFRHKIKYSVAGAVASIALVLIPAYALVAVIQPQQFQQIIISMDKQVQNSAEQIRQANAQKERLEELTRQANTISDGIKNGLPNAVQARIDSITNGPVGTLLRNAGLSITNVTGPAAVGHVDPDTTKRQMTEIGAVTNPVSAITAQTKITLENKLHDRLNVTSMLDEKPANSRCKTTTTNCTILTMLREYDDVALTDLQKVNIGAVAYQVEQKGMWSSAVLNQVYMLVGTDTFNVLSFLTPSHSIPLGFDRNAATAATLDKSMWLSQVMVGGKNDAQFLAKEMQNSKGADTAGQIDAMAKIAKVQLARGAIMNVHNENLHLSLNAQFRACVVRPDVQDRVGATQEQQLVHIQSLLRCSNMIQLQQRQQEMESQRLLGTMLLTLLDLYAVQEPKRRNGS